MTDDEGDSDVESATDVTLKVGGEVDVGCDCCPGGVCSATQPNVVVNDFQLLHSDVDEDDYEGWARYEHSHKEWTGSLSFDISMQDPETAFSLGRWLERLEHTEGQCHTCDRNVAAHEPAWLFSDGPRCPLCKRFLDCTMSGSLGDVVRFVVECQHCRYDRGYEGEDAQWASQQFYDAIG